MIIYYGSYSTTAGEEYSIGYEEGNPNTGNVIVKQIDGKKDKEYKEIIILDEEGKKMLREYKNIIKDKLKEPIDLKKLYYKQFD